MLFTPSNKRRFDVAHADKLSGVPPMQHGRPPFVPLVLKRRVFTDPPSTLRRIGLDAAHQPKLIARPCRVPNPALHLSMGDSRVRGFIK